jgi:hypothetical protein
MSRFVLVSEDGGPEDLPHQVMSKKVKGKQSAFNSLAELDIDPDDEKEEETFTIQSDLFDYGTLTFKSIEAVVSYTSTKGFDCKIYRNGKPYGYWSPEDGITRF